MVRGICKWRNQGPRHSFLSVQEDRYSWNVGEVGPFSEAYYRCVIVITGSRAFSRAFLTPEQAMQCTRRFPSTATKFYLLEVCNFGASAGYQPKEMELRSAVTCLSHVSCCTRLSKGTRLALHVIQGKQLELIIVQLQWRKLGQKLWLVGESSVNRSMLVSS